MDNSSTSKSSWKALIGLALVAGLATSSVYAHCQVPCGIYDDVARVARLKEDAATIAKAVTNIHDLAGKHDAQSLNQISRWVANKESHASHIIEVIAEYFLAQRVKPVAAGSEGHGAYLKSLGEHHAVIVAAMKAKQKADPAAVKALNDAIDTMGKAYHHEH